jgi:hypothetical protein
MKKVSEIAQSIIRPFIGFLKGGKTGLNFKNSTKDRSMVVRK